MHLFSARNAATLAVLLLLPACDFLTGGGGGGGGGGTVDFQRGLVHVRKDDRNLYVADERGYDNVAQLTSGGGVYTPALSRDGRVAVFVARTSTASVIAAIPTRGGDVTQIFASTSTVQNLRTPIFSPDGTYVAFAYDEAASSSIGAVNVDGSGFIKLGGGGVTAYSSPSFLADGSLLVAAGDLGSGYSRIERIDLTSGATNVVLNTLGNDAQTISTRLVASPDGRFAAFDGRIGSGASRIFVLDLNSSVVTQLTDYASEPSAVDSSPAWVGSANLAFSSNTGGADQVYVLQADGVKTSGGLTLPKAIEPWYGPN